MVFAQLASLDRTLVVAILLAPARIKAPGLNRRTRRRRDVDVAPRRRHAQRVDARERPFVANRALVCVDVSKSGSLRALAADPAGHLADPAGQEPRPLSVYGLANGLKTLLALAGHCTAGLKSAKTPSALLVQAHACRYQICRSSSCIIACPSASGGAASRGHER